MFSGLTLHQGLVAFFAFWIVVGLAMALITNALYSLLTAPKQSAEYQRKRRLDLW